MARKSSPEPDFDRELADLPPELRWREWKARVEAVLFAAAKPVTRDILVPPDILSERPDGTSNSHEGTAGHPAEYAGTATGDPHPGFGKGRSWGNQRPEPPAPEGAP